MYTAIKIVDGFSTCFRQWRAKSHCRFIHGYALKFELTFASENLDANNWVKDFAFLKSEDFKIDGYNLKDWFSYMFDHTTIIQYDDPEYSVFKVLEESGLIQMRTMDRISCEAFAEFVFCIISLSLNKDKGIKLIKVRCIENEKNSATYER